MADSSRSVTVLGLGRMGASLASALARAGNAVTVWNRTATRTASVAALGVRAADSIADACASSEVVVVCVSDYDATRRMLNDDAVVSALQGRTLVQLSSGSPDQARELSAWAAESGIDYVDGKIVGYPAAIGTPEASIFCAGSATAFGAAQPILSDLCAAPMYLGDDVGHPSVVDGALILNVMCLFVADMVGRAMFESEGIAPTAWNMFVELLLAEAPTQVSALNARLELGNFDGDEAALRTWAHGTDLLVESLEESGVDATLAGCIAGLAHRAIERGHGEDGFAAIYHVVTHGRT